VRAVRLGRAALREIATIVTPDPLLRWHRQLIARKWTPPARAARRGMLVEIRRLVVRMATENPNLGLHADPRRAQESRTSGRPLDDRSNSERPRVAAGAAATDLLADVLARPLGRDCGR